MMAVSVIFADGSMLTAPTWRDLEQQLREDPWNPDDKVGFRAEMARRAWAWSYTEVSASTSKSSRTFIARLQEAGMLMVIEDDEEGEAA